DTFHSDIHSVFRKVPNKALSAIALTNFFVIILQQMLTKQRGAWLTFHYGTTSMLTFFKRTEVKARS
ncbi:hypothetical protein ACTGWY_11185, partial [Streptococcus suis]